MNTEKNYIFISNPKVVVAYHCGTIFRQNFLLRCKAGKVIKATTTGANEVIFITSITVRQNGNEAIHA